LAGLGTAGIGVSVLLVRAQYEELIGSSLINMAAYVAIAGGGIVVFIAMAGCVGAIEESRKLLLLVKSLELFKAISVTFIIICLPLSVIICLMKKCNTLK
jgi:hypothetical protein